MSCSTGDNPTPLYPFVVLEYMEGGDVRWKDSEDRPVLLLDEARSIFRDVVLGLEYCKYRPTIEVGYTVSPSLCTQPDNCFHQGAT